MLGDIRMEFPKKNPSSSKMKHKCKTRTCNFPKQNCGQCSPVRRSKCLPKNVTEYGVDYANSRYDSGEYKINCCNVENLVKKWSYTTVDDSVTPPRAAVVSSNPSIVDDVVYFGDSAGSIYALNAFDGSVIWRTVVQPYAFPIAPSIGEDRIYISGFISTIPPTSIALALDKTDGHIIWQNNFPGLTQGSLCTSGPGLVEEEDIVIFRFATLPLAFISSGYVIALRASTGTEIWKFQTTLDPSDPRTDGGGGVGIFSASPAFDTKLGLMYTGTGSNHVINGVIPKVTPIQDSLIALNYRTENPKGELVWFYRTNNIDDIVDFVGRTGQDWDASGGPYLLNVKDCDGCTRKIVSIGTKKGDQFGLDRATGELVWKTVLNSPPPEGQNDAGANVFGCTDGETIWVTSLYSNTGRRTNRRPENTATALLALRGSDGQVMWRRDFPGLTFSGLTLANGLIYYTDYTGVFRVLNACSGEVLFEFINDLSPTFPNNGFIGGATVYKGMVYLSRGSSGSAYPIQNVTVPGGILVFELGH